MKKVAIIGIRGLPAQYGAFDQFVDQLVNYSNKNNKSVKFYVSSEIKTNTKIDNVEQFYFFRGKGVFVIFNYFISIINFYLKGVRTFLFFGYGAAIFFPLLKIFNCKIICNVDGIEWRRNISKLKSFYFKFSEFFVSKIKINLIFDSLVIQRYYAIKYNVVGNLIYYPSDFNDLIKNNLINKKKIKPFLKAIIVMRFLPENNIVIIVDAFNKLNLKNSNKYKLYIIGKENDYFKSKIIPNIIHNKNIIFVGPVYDRKKLFKLWSSADCYIHGHSVGGTNPTLIEAISLKLPIIAFNVMFNKKILGKNSSYFSNSDDLLKTIKNHHFLQKKTYLNSDLFKAEYINEKYLDLIKG